MMNALRLNDGVPRALFTERTNNFTVVALWKIKLMD